MASRPRRREPRLRSPTELIDDVMREIFLRVRGDDPASLVRSAACCWGWRSILSHPDFAHDYRSRRGAPPVLGFFHNERHSIIKAGIPYETFWVSSHFVPTATFRPPACHDRRRWHVLDSRHGLVLFYTAKKNKGFVVYDLVTGDQWNIHADPKCYDIMWWERDEDLDKRVRCNAAVFCADDRCDHLDCHGRPFRVALVGSEGTCMITMATVYSSETRQWMDTVSVQNPDIVNGRGNSAVLGNKVYDPIVEMDRVVEYNMDMHEQQLSVINLAVSPLSKNLAVILLTFKKKLSVINLPFDDQDWNQEHTRIEFMGVEDGSLLFASVLEGGLYLWSMEAGPSGAAGWARRRVMELEPVLPSCRLRDRANMPVGFAEGLGVIFLTTINELYTMELNSGKGNKVHDMSFEKVVPYRSFCTGAWGWLTASDEASHAVVGARRI